MRFAVKFVLRDAARPSIEVPVLHMRLSERFGINKLTDLQTVYINLKLVVTVLCIKLRATKA